MRLVVVQAGRLRDANLIAARSEYLKRFRKYGRLDVIEAEPKPGRALWPEGVGWRILLDERGERLDSVAFARLLDERTMRQGTVAFAIGDGHGHDPETAAAADQRLRLSDLVMPHQLAHLVLIEQLYRAATILRNEPYHH